MTVRGLGLARQQIIVKHAHFFCGAGGGALGFQQGGARLGNTEAVPMCLGGLDFDPGAVADFTRLVGVPATVMDLFSAGQFADYHSSCTDPKAKRCRMCSNTGLPPRDWREITPADVRAAFRGQCPDIVFTSPPCKGFSGLLPKKSAGARRYQALNRLTLRSIELALAAFADDPPSLILLENVPGIMQRGRHLVDEMERVLTRAGYAVAKTTHDCGELGGLAQHRRRFLLVARHKVKVPPFLYEPPKLRVRAVGDVLGEMPVPLGGAGGPMHALPELAFQTWLRLALIDAGKDWRCLVGKDLSEMIVQRIGTVELFNGALGVRAWDQPAATVTARAGMYNSASAAVADPRRVSRPVGSQLPRDGRIPFNNIYRLIDFKDVSPAITGGGTPTSGGLNVADPRVQAIEPTPPEGTERRSSAFGVRAWSEPSGTVAGESYPSNGVYAVGDPRPPATVGDYSAYGVKGWDDTSATITGKAAAGGGPFNVADPRTEELPLAPVEPAPEQAPAPSAPAPSEAAQLVQDAAKPPSWQGSGKYKVTDPSEPAGTIIAESATGNGGYAVADGRVRVKVRDENGEKIPGGPDEVDPLPGWDRDPSTPHAYASSGHFGVLPWDGTSNAVTGSACHDNSKSSVADPRLATVNWALPEAEERGVFVIVSLDGTWHRPFTTLELAALQSYPWRLLVGEPMVGGDTARREHIGNSVPPDAAQAVANVMFEAILGARLGEHFQLSLNRIWVAPVQAALSVATEDEMTLQ